MQIDSIKLHREIDNTPDRLDTHGELDQGETFTKERIYELTLKDGQLQTSAYLRVTITHNSYGNAETVSDPVVVRPTPVTVTHWQAV